MSKLFRPRPSYFNELIAVAAAAISASAIAILTLRDDLSARFGPIDDHEPLSWMGSGSRVNPNQFFSTLLNKTEIGDFGRSSRFRPAYYLYRVSQSIIFGDNPAWWYISVIVLFIVTIATLAYVTSIWVRVSVPVVHEIQGLLLAVIVPAGLTLLFGALAAWPGIITRLGPSELLAVFGTAICMLGITKALIGQSQLWWISILIGAWIAVLAKENFLIIALVPAVLAIAMIYRGLNKPRQLVLAFIGLAPGILVAIALYQGTRGSTTDVYGHAIDANRISESLSSLFGTYRWYWIHVFALTVAGFFIWALFRWKQDRQIVATLIAFLFLSALWITFDSWAYFGKYELTRYWIVFNFLKLLWLIAALAIGVHVFVTAGNTVRKTAAGIYLLLPIGFLSIAFINVPSALQNISVEANANTIMTMQYQDALSYAYALGDKEKLPITIVTGSNLYAEPAHAIAIDLGRNTNAEIFFANLGQAPIYEVTDSTDTSTEVRSHICLFVGTDPSPMSGCNQNLSMRIPVASK